MASTQVTEATFDEAIATGKIVLVDFWAAWCGPCRMFAPIFEAASQRHPDITFAKVDVEAEQALAARFSIMSIPTLMAFRDQILLFAQPGALPEAALEDLITQIEALDMDAVRAELAGAEPAARTA